MYGMSCGHTIDASKLFSKRYLSASATALLTLSSFSSFMTVALNFSAISIAWFSFVTTIVFSIRGDIDVICRISSSIILHNDSIFCGDKSKRVFALEKVFTGIITAIFKLHVNLF